MKKKNKYKIDDYKEWYGAYLGCIDHSLEECKIIFYNKEHYKRVWPADKDSDFQTIHKQIKTYGDALLYKNSKFWFIRELCGHILKGDIEIYD